MVSDYSEKIRFDLKFPSQLLFTNQDNVIHKKNRKEFSVISLCPQKEKLQPQVNFLVLNTYTIFLFVFYLLKLELTSYTLILF